jgi:hypothetical protein
LELDGTTGALLRVIDGTGRFAGVATDGVVIIAGDLVTYEVRRYDFASGAFLGVLATTAGYPTGIAITVVPETGTSLLLMAGLMALSTRRRG